MDNEKREDKAIKLSERITVFAWSLTQWGFIIGVTLIGLTQLVLMFIELETFKQIQVVGEAILSTSKELLLTTAFFYFIAKID